MLAVTAAPIEQGSSCPEARAGGPELGEAAETLRPDLDDGSMRLCSETSTPGSVENLESRSTTPARVEELICLETHVRFPKMDSATLNCCIPAFVNEELATNYAFKLRS